MVDSADVGSDSAHVGTWGRSKTAPRFAASWLGSMHLQPLLLHACNLRTKRFPVAFRYGRLADLVDDVGEVLEAGDWCFGSGINHGDILAGTSKEDGS